MTIKTALQIINAIDKIETTDLDGRHLKNSTQDFVIEQYRKLFPNLKFVYIPGKGFTSEKK